MAWLENVLRFVFNDFILFSFVMGGIVKYILHTTGKIKETYLIYISLSNLLFIIYFFRN